MGNVSFDEEQSASRPYRVQKKSGGLTALFIKFHLARTEQEASTRLLALAVVLFIGTLFLFISGNTTPDDRPIDPTDPALLDQTL